MRNLEFNFNNEVDTFTIIENDNGTITVPGPNGDVIAEYDNLKQFCEMYASMRDVHPDNLKNWVIVENGDVVSFVLRAGTAGVAIGEIRQYVTQGIDQIREGGQFHPLDLQRMVQSLDAINDDEDIVNVLVNAEQRDIARVLYDFLNNLGALTGTVEEPEPEDTRTELEVYLDRILEVDKTLAFFANLVGIPVEASREEVVTALNDSPVPYTPDMLCDLYEGAIDAAVENGINVTDRKTAIMVITQSVPFEGDDTTKAKLIQTARMAGRARVNATIYTIGIHHVKKSAEIVAIADIEDRDIYLIDNVPAIINFNADIDAELEAERDAELAEAGEAANDRTPDDDFDDYDEDFDDDGNEDDEF